MAIMRKKCAAGVFVNVCHGGAWDDPVAPGLDFV